MTENYRQTNTAFHTVFIDQDYFYLPARCWFPVSDYLKNHPWEVEHVVLLLYTPVHFQFYSRT